MQLGLIIEHRYPNAVAFTDYEVRADEQGNQYISYWNEATLGPQPTTEQLQSWELAATKAHKERQIRDAADRWYRVNVRPFEGSIVVHQSAAGAAMTQEERDIRAAMQANYLTMRTLVGQVRAATTPEEAAAIEWVEPQSAQIATLSAAIGEAEAVITSARNRRKERMDSGRLGNLEQRVSDLEADLEARARVFEV